MGPEARKAEEGRRRARQKKCSFLKKSAKKLLLSQMRGAFQNAHACNGAKVF
jgi:hypothetical protein